jgi:hypothetical protein
MSKVSNKELIEFFKKIVVPKDDPRRNRELYEGATCECGHIWDLHKEQYELDGAWDGAYCEGKEQLEDLGSINVEENEGCCCGFFRPIKRDKRT